MERSEWDDDEPVVPPAPLPAHERSWRHPSELAAAQQRTTTTPPPLPGGPGRAIAVAAGTVGVLIGIGLLTLMLPGSPDGEVSAPGTSGPTAPESAAPPVTDGETPPSSALAVAPPPTAPDTAAVEPPLATTAETSTVPTTVAPVAPPNTVHLTDVGAVALPLSADGYLVTTASAVAGRGSRFEVVTPDGERRAAMLVATGEGLAILRIDVPRDGLDATMSTARLGDHEAVPVEGSWVTVYGPTTARAVLVSTDAGLALAGLGSEEPLLEGAPVVDAAGRVVGLCTRVRGTTTVVLAHPAQQVKDSAREQAWLGVAGAPNGDGDGEQAAPLGVRVLDVLAGSPAAEAGVLAGDDIIRFGDTTVDSILQLADLVAASAPGDAVTLVVVRGDEEVTLEVTLAARPFAT